MNNHAPPPHFLAAVGLSLLLAAAACSKPSGAGSAGGSATGAGLVFTTHSTDPIRPSFHDFGKVAFGERVSHVFTLENTDDQAVTILTFQAACSCTKLARLECVTRDGERSAGDPSQTEEMISVPPGATLEMTVMVDTARVKPNLDKLAIVRIRTDSKQSPFLSLEMHVLAEKAFNITPARIEIGNVPHTAGGTGSASIVAAIKGSDWTIEGLASEPEIFTANLIETSSFGEGVWRLDATLPPGHSLGRVSESVKLETRDADGNQGPPLEIAVAAKVVEDILVVPSLFAFGPVERGAKSEVEATLRALVPGSRVRILNAEVGGAGEHVGLRYEPVDPDTVGRSVEWRLFLSQDGGLEKGRFTGQVTLELDDSQNPTVVTQFTGQML